MCRDGDGGMYACTADVYHDSLHDLEVGVARFICLCFPPFQQLWIYHGVDGLLRRKCTLSLIKHTSTLPATTVERWFGMKEIKIKFSLVFMLLSFHPHRPKSLASTGLVFLFTWKRGRTL